MDTIRTVIDVMQRAQEPIRPYMKKVVKNEVFEPEFARYKLTVYYKSQKRAPYPSLDYVEKENGATIRDEHESLKKLIRLAEKKIKESGQIKSIVIYACLDKLPIYKTADYNIPVYTRTYTYTKTNDQISFNPRNEMYLRSKN